jgi:hypothetical protein
MLCLLGGNYVFMDPRPFTRRVERCHSLSQVGEFSARVGVGGLCPARGVLMMLTMADARLTVAAVKQFVHRSFLPVDDKIKALES